MAVKEAALFRLIKLEPHVALIPVKHAVVEAEWKACRKLIKEVCLEQGWDEVDELLERYARPGWSDTWLASNLTGDVMGAVMLTEGHLPMMELSGGWPRLQLQGNRPAEVSIIAVLKEHRTHGVDLALLRQIETHSREVGITDWYVVFDDRRFALYTGIGLPFEEVPESEGGGRHEFWGEECFPARLNRAKGEAYVKQYSPTLYKILANGNHD